MGLFAPLSFPFLSDPPPKAPPNKKAHQILFLHPSASGFVHKRGASFAVLMGPDSGSSQM